MLKITGTGFHMTFANGWTASVQFGPGTYSDNHDADFEPPQFPYKSGDAEVAAWNGKGGLVKLGADTVAGRLDADAVLAFLNSVAAGEPKA